MFEGKEKEELNLKTFDPSELPEGVSCELRTVNGKQ